MYSSGSDSDHEPKPRENSIENALGKLQIKKQVQKLVEAALRKEKPHNNNKKQKGHGGGGGGGGGEKPRIPKINGICQLNAIPIEGRTFFEKVHGVIEKPHIKLNAHRDVFVLLVGVLDKILRVHDCPADGNKEVVVDMEKEKMITFHHKHRDLLEKILFRVPKSEDFQPLPGEKKEMMLQSKNNNWIMLYKSVLRRLFQEHHYKPKIHFMSALTRDFFPSGTEYSRRPHPPEKFQDSKMKPEGGWELPMGRVY
jgi:hypothetical protein